MSSFVLGAVTYAAFQSGIMFSFLDFVLPREYVSILLFMRAVGTIALRMAGRKLRDLQDSCCSARKQKEDEFLSEHETNTTATANQSNIAAIPTMRKPRVLKEEEQNMDTGK
jgi:cell division protein FtsL